MQILWSITSNDLPSPERSRFWCMSEVGWIQPQLSGSSCWAKCPPWIHDGLNSWSHCGRICIYSGWVSGYVLGSIQTQHASITSALPQFWRRQSCHPSRLNNKLDSICLSHSALTSGRLWGHCTTQKAFLHTWKILGFPPWRQFTALMLHPWQSAKNLLSGPGKKNIQHPQDSQWPLYAGQWIRIFFGPCIQFAEVCAKRRPLFFLTNMTALHHGLWLGQITPTSNIAFMWALTSPTMEGGILWDLFLKGSSSTILISCCTRPVQPNSPGSSEKMSWYWVNRSWADVQFAPDHQSSPDKCSCWRSISFLCSIDILVCWIPCILSNFFSVPDITS